MKLCCILCASLTSLSVKNRDPPPLSSHPALVVDKSNPSPCSTHIAPSQIRKPDHIPSCSLYSVHQHHSPHPHPQYARHLTRTSRTTRTTRLGRAVEGRTALGAVGGVHCWFRLRFGLVAWGGLRGVVELVRGGVDSREMVVVKETGLRDGYMKDEG
ncbi:hypothetical protein EX30DRAFT_340464 [Ascodesmis nigricans]|uniref:Uncharacterized protein n=1 Tax=Ascodesmis nigricans TaxID=341454 RepID=A0A4S2MYA6_9PEZI|nr:hypothetical protein EX30DRAFT_340464 [Ascodesmis nigricans]